MVGGAHAWANTGKHYDFDFLAGQERVPQDHGELTLTEGHVLSLRCLTLLSVKGSDALLEAEQGLVDLSTLSLTVLAVALAILGTFTTGQIDEEELSTLSHSLFLDLDLCDGVTPTGGIVGLGGMRCPHGIALLDQVENLIIVVHELLLETSDLNHIIFVLSQTELVVLVQKVIELSSVDLIHGHGDSEIPLMVLPVVDAPLEEILDSDALQAVHRVSFSRTGLSVGEYGDDTLVEYEIQNRTNLIEIQLFVGLIVRERVVEPELCVFNRLAHSVYFVFAVVDYDLWVRDRDDIDLTISKLLLENGALLEAHTDLHLVSKNVLPTFRDLFPLGFHHGLEIDVYLNTLQFIISFSLTLEFTGFLHSETASIPVNFNLIDFICGGDLTGRHSRGSHSKLNTGGANSCRNLVNT